MGAREIEISKRRQIDLGLQGILKKGGTNFSLLSIYFETTNQDFVIINYQLIAICPMQKPEIPANESDRLLALNRYKVLDTLPEQEYDDLTQLAADICGTPISLISLVDQDRQWFKSRVGLDATETPRDISFCGHAVADGEILNIPDATQDVRFADNPLVLQDPNIRFYAGVPLITRPLAN